jgi:hypothetical protein
MIASFPPTAHLQNLIDGAGPARVVFKTCCALICAVMPPAVLGAGEGRLSAAAPADWQQRAVAYARMLTEVEWSPAAEGMPSHPRRADRYFEPGVTYRGVPYSNGGYEGRYIGFDIFVKTFLAAAENPRSILYSKDLRGQKNNSAGYYGMVCSAFTSYVLQTGTMFPSGAHVAPHRAGVELVETEAARAGDVVWMPGHVAVITNVERDAAGALAMLRMEESTPPTTRTRDMSPAEFEAYLESRKGSLHRIKDFDAWLEGKRVPELLFPNYAEDSAKPVINRVLLLDRGDWVPYRRGEPVQFNIMDRDGGGVKSLVIRREGEVVETVLLEGPGVVERVYDACGDYTAACVMADGSTSQACEFAVCALDSNPPDTPVRGGEEWEIAVSAENMRVILVRIEGGGHWDGSYASPRVIWLTDEDRKLGRVRIPADTRASGKKFPVSVEGENRYGRLRNYHSVPAASE